MQTKWPWLERIFNFDFPAEKMPDILERLLGTTVRIEAVVNDLDDGPLAKRERADSWSIKENIGHLACLEPLWMQRFDDMLSGVETMCEADLTNQPTNDANFNSQNIETIVSAFQRHRTRMIRMLRELSVAQWSATALHPRLACPMRVVDLCMFVADHDDYHLARIRYLSELFAKKTTA